MISLLVPSRGRPEQLRAMWQSAQQTATHPELIELLVYLDADDSALDEYLSVGGRQHVARRRLLSETWNELLPWAAGGILWHGNDDVIFRSADWDTRIRAAYDRLPDRIACVHGRDGIHNQHLATLGFYSREWVNALGYFMPPYFSSDYNDLWLSTVADMIGRRVFLDEVYTEHMHPAVGKAEIDQTHRDRLDRHRADDVDRLYRELAPKRAEDAEKLLAAIVAAGVTER